MYTLVKDTSSVNNNNIQQNIQKDIPFYKQICPYDMCIFNVLTRNDIYNARA